MHDGGLGDGPIQDQYREGMKALGEALDEALNGDVKPRTTGFVLIVFAFDDGQSGEGRCNYISNASRADVIVMLKEQLARFEGRVEPTPGHA